MPAWRAASRIVVPAGTVTEMPLIEPVTTFVSVLVAIPCPRSSAAGLTIVRRRSFGARFEPSCAGSPEAGWYHRGHTRLLHWGAIWGTLWRTIRRDIFGRLAAVREEGATGVGGATDDHRARSACAA